MATKTKLADWCMTKIDRVLPGKPGEKDNEMRDAIFKALVAMQTESMQLARDELKQQLCTLLNTGS